MTRHAPRIGVWIDPSTAIGGGVIAGIIDVARVRGWRLTRDRIDIDGAIADIGVTVVGGLPAVRVLADDALLPNITCDAPAIGTMAADHFRERGFRHFVFVGDEDTDDAVGDGFALAVERAFPNRDHTFAREDAAHAFSDVELAGWLAVLPRPLACLCASDGLAARVARSSPAFSWHGRPARVSVRKDTGESPVPRSLPIAVLGIGNDPLVCELSDTPISSIDINAHQIGVRAAELLARRLVNKAVKNFIVPPRGIVERASTDVLAIADEEITAVLRFISHHAATPIGVADLVRASSLTRRSLERRFEKLLGRSPAEVLRRRRITIAQRLLAGTDASIAEIAKRCGFSLPQHLAAAFRQLVGQTPTEYRKNMRNDGGLGTSLPNR